MSITQDISDRKHFNHWSKTYERSLAQWFFFDRVHAGLLRRIPGTFTPQVILDIGCGTGRLLRKMHARWPSAALFGVDLAEGMVEQAQRLTPSASIHLAPAENLPLKNTSVDLVTSTVSFHHWNDQAAGIREAARVLRPGGLFILADMNISSHGHPLSRPDVRRYFESASLSVRSQSSPVPYFTFTVGEKPC